jgi:hypothetical protein
MVVVSVFESGELIDPRSALGYRLAKVFHFILRDLQAGFDARQARFKVASAAFE